MATRNSSEDLWERAEKARATQERVLKAGGSLDEMKGWAATARDYERRAAAKQVRGK